MPFNPSDRSHCSPYLRAALEEEDRIRAAWRAKALALGWDEYELDVVHNVASGMGDRIAEVCEEHIVLERFGTQRFEWKRGTAEKILARLQAEERARQPLPMPELPTAPVPWKPKETKRRAEPALPRKTGQLGLFSKD